MHKILLGLCLLLGVVSSATAYYSTQSDMGVYLGVNAGYDYVDLHAPQLPNTGTRQYDGFAWGGNVGVQANHYFAVELGYNRLAAVTQGGADLFANNNILHLALKGTLPGTDNMDFFAKAGGALVSGAYNGGPKVQRYTPYFSLGGAYKVSSVVAITLEADTVLRSGTNDGSIMPKQYPAAYYALLGVNYLIT